MDPATLILAVTLALPGIGDRSATLEFKMPDMERCHRVARDLAAASDPGRTFNAVCLHRIEADASGQRSDR